MFSPSSYHMTHTVLCALEEKKMTNIQAIR